MLIFFRDKIRQNNFLINLGNNYEWRRIKKNMERRAETQLLLTKVEELMDTVSEQNYHSRRNDNSL